MNAITAITLLLMSIWLQEQLGNNLLTWMTFCLGLFLWTVVVIRGVFDLFATGDFLFGILGTLIWSVVVVASFCYYENLR